MLAAWRLSSGVIFDTRSVVLSMGTLFYGTLPGRDRRGHRRGLPGEPGRVRRRDGRVGDRHVGRGGCALATLASRRAEGPERARALPVRPHRPRAHARPDVDPAGPARDPAADRGPGDRHLPARLGAARPAHDRPAPPPARGASICARASSGTARSSRTRRSRCGSRTTPRSRRISRRSPPGVSTTSRATCSSIPRSTRGASGSRARSTPTRRPSGCSRRGSREELLARNSDLYRRDRDRGIHRFWAAMLSGERSATFEEANLSLKGVELDVLETCTVVPGHEATFDRVYIADVDVTERRRAEQQVRRQAEQLSRIVEGSVLAMSQVVELRDPYTAGHQRRVAELAVAIAGELGASADGTRRPAACGAHPRHRQARGAGRDPLQARPAQRRRVHADQGALPSRTRHHQSGRVRASGRGDRAAAPRARGRFRLPAGDDAGTRCCRKPG